MELPAGNFLRPSYRCAAARRSPIVPLIAETGGLNTKVVDATALPEQVADDLVMSAFRSALRLLYLQEDVADNMLKMIEGAAREMSLGNTAQKTTDIGLNYLLRFAQEQVVSINTAAAGGNASLIAMGE